MTAGIDRGGPQAHFGTHEILLRARLIFYLFFVCVTAVWGAGARGGWRHFQIFH